MTQPPQDDDRRPEPGGQQPYGPPSPQYGQPRYGEPQSGQPQYGPPPAGAPQQFGPPGQDGPPQYGPPQYGPPPYGPPQYGPPQYGPPQYGQPPYGQPPQYGPPRYGPVSGAPQDFNRPYGQPPAAPGPYVAGPYGAPYGPAPAPQKSRVGAIAGGTLLLVLLIAGAVVAALTLGPRILSREAAERDVAAQFQEIKGVAIDLECPDDMVLESGAEYTCTGVTEDGQEVQLAIAVTDPPGDAEYTWAEI